MTITTKKPVIGAGLKLDPVHQGLIQSIIDRIERPRVEAVADLDQTISNPPTQAQVQAISDKIDELLAAFRTANILDS